jgi:hypothetical protein
MDQPISVDPPVRQQVNAPEKAVIKNHKLPLYASEYLPGFDFCGGADRHQIISLIKHLQNCAFSSTPPWEVDVTQHDGLVRSR